MNLDSNPGEILNGTHLLGDQTSSKYMVILKDLPYNSALFGLEI